MQIEYKDHHFTLYLFGLQSSNFCHDHPHNFGKSFSDSHIVFFFLNKIFFFKSVVAYNKMEALIEREELIEKAISFNISLNLMNYELVSQLKEDLFHLSIQDLVRFKHRYKVIYGSQRINLNSTNFKFNFSSIMFYHIPSSANIASRKTLWQTRRKNESLKI